MRNRVRSPKREHISYLYSGLKGSPSLYRLAQENLTVLADARLASNNLILWLLRRYWWKQLNLLVIRWQEKVQFSLDSWQLEAGSSISNTQVSRLPLFESCFGEITLYHIHFNECITFTTCWSRLGVTTDLKWMPVFNINMACLNPDSNLSFWHAHSQSKLMFKTWTLQVQPVCEPRNSPSDAVYTEMLSAFLGFIYYTHTWVCTAALVTTLVQSCCCGSHVLHWLIKVISLFLDLFFFALFSVKLIF